MPKDCVALYFLSHYHQKATDIKQIWSSSRIETWEAAIQSCLETCSLCSHVGAVFSFVLSIGVLETDCNFDSMFWLRFVFRQFLFNTIDF